MRTMLVAATGLVIAAALVGCGSDGPTAEERAANAKWVQRVDGLCRRANAGIATRGYPVDLIDLDRLVVRAIEDTRGAIDAIARERLPEGAGPRPGAFVRELRELDDAVERIGTLDPPLWAADQTAAYQRALRDLQAVSQEFAARLAEDRGKPLEILDRGEHVRIERELTNAPIAEEKARRKMLKAVGAGPTSPPSAGAEPVEPATTEQS